MVLTIDIGNTNTVLIVYDSSSRIVSKQRHITKKGHCEDYYKSLLTGFNVEGVVLSCVVPAIEDVVVNILETEYENVTNLKYGTVSSFKNNLADKHAIGADFIATSIGAYEQYKQAVIVADIGSASKITFTNDLGEFCGGVIMPGLGTSVKALNDFIPHLPHVQLKIPDRVIGHDTVSSIQSGILYGLIAQIEGLSNQMEAERNVEAIKILTGGYAPLIADKLPGFIHGEDLVNIGLLEVYHKINER